MDKIPPEIVYVICSRLEIDDILNFRLVNKLFADVGATYMLPNVTFYMHQEELDRLAAISLHPIFSKHVISLTHYAETVVSPKVTWAEFLRDHPRRIRWNGKLREAPHQLLAQYKKYSDAVDEQDEFMKKQKDTDVLKEVLPRFPKLQTVEMAAGHWYCEKRYRVRRKTPFPEFFKQSYMSDIYPEGKRPLDALLIANAHSPCVFTNLCVKALHWRFFKRNEQELTYMFKPLSGLTYLDLAISVEPTDERIRDGNSRRKCQRVLARGGIRKILKYMPQLESLRVAIESPEDEEQGKGAWLGDVIEPGFRWGNLKTLMLGGIASNRTELMKVLMLHKRTLRSLCLQDVTLTSTSWRKLLPDIRNNLSLEEACICGEIDGEFEDADDMQEAWDDPMEYWDLSDYDDVPMSTESRIYKKKWRQSINMYCRQGGKKYPDELPLSKLVVEKYYDEYVKPFFPDDSHGDLKPSLSEGENDGNWEDVTDEELDNAMNDVSVENPDRDSAILLLHSAMADALVPLPSMGYYDDDDDDADANTDTDADADMIDDMLDLGVENIHQHHTIDLIMGLSPSMIGPSPFVGFTEQSDIEFDDEMPDDEISDPEIPELVYQ
ncbi:hypothetical protein F4825DRAFT_456515 [Nemania diffusa]|nr:hypothetical protein F4825DRAFT_456515 [Nemania diffusa]